MAVVTISRELGSRGTRIAEAVGAKLGAPCIDKEVLAEMARQVGVQVEVIVEAEEKLMSRAGVVSQEMRSLISADPSQRGRPMDQPTYVKQMTDAIRTLAQVKDAIFIGRGSQLILEDHPTALHVHLYATPDLRASRRFSAAAVWPRSIRPGESSTWRTSSAETGINVSSPAPTGRTAATIT